MSLVTDGTTVAMHKATIVPCATRSSLCKIGSCTATSATTCLAVIVLVIVDAGPGRCHMSFGAGKQTPCGQVAQGVNVGGREEGTRGASQVEAQPLAG